jgi:hypothetical protein
MENYLAQQLGNPALGSGLKGQTGLSYFQKLLPNLVTLGFIAGALIFFFVMIAGAIQWITSGGEKTALEAARGKLTSAIVGLIILLAVFAIVKLIETFFGINILILDIGALQIQ